MKPSTRVTKVLLSLSCLLAPAGCYQGALAPSEAMTTMAQMQAQFDEERNEQLLLNLATVRLGLESYAIDHQGEYPSADAVVETLTDVYSSTVSQAEAMTHVLGERWTYLPGKRLPTNPWASQEIHQTNSVTLTGLQPALSGAGRPPTSVGTTLGQGKVAASPHHDGLTFGVLAYDYDPDTKSYVLYAIGKQGDQAIVTGFATNLPN